MENNDLEKVNNKKIDKKEKTDKNKNIETKVVLERRKPSVFLSFILILIGAVICALIFLIFFGDKIINQENQEIQEQDDTSEGEKVEIKEVVKEVRKLNLNVEGDFITLLYGKLTTYNSFLPLVYNVEKTTFDSLSDNNKLLYTLSNSKSIKMSLRQVASKLDNKMTYKEQEMSNYSADKIEIKDASKKYKSIYGSDKEIPLIDADTGMGYVYEYVPEDNCFYGHSYMGGGGWSFSYKTNIKFL